jgi:hypothetical protein
MDTTDYISIAVLGGLVGAVLCALILSERIRAASRFRGHMAESLPALRPGAALSRDTAELEEICRQVAAGVPACALVEPTSFRILHRGLHGRLDFISDKTELHMDTVGLIHQVVEVVPVGFPMSLISSGGPKGLRARGSKTEYDRIFKNRAQEKILFEIGVPYDLRMGPDGVTFRIHLLPGNAAVLGYWIACAFRMIDLIPGVGQACRVEVIGVTNEVAADTACQVCGSTLASGAIVRCAKCSTPHHEECWQYARKCSTFGCASQRFVR